MALKLQIYSNYLHIQIIPIRPESRRGLGFPGWEPYYCWVGCGMCERLIEGTWEPYRKKYYEMNRKKKKKPAPLPTTPGEAHIIETHISGVKVI